MDYILLYTILAILLSSLIGVFLSRRKKDICLKDFQNFLVTMQLKSGKRIWGRFCVETSGVELRYKGNYWDKDHVETSFILYKEEMGTVYAFFRFHDELSEVEKARRLRAIKRAYRPGPVRRTLRHLRNFFNTIRDALNEAVGTAVAHAKTANPALRALTDQRYVSKVQTELTGYLGTSYDPILEKHIGTMVVLEITTPQGAIEEHVGIFKEYSPQFLEVMDVKYPDGDRVRVCDIVVPRAHAFIRHSGELVTPQSAQSQAQRDVPTPAGE